MGFVGNIKKKTEYLSPLFYAAHYNHISPTSRTQTTSETEYILLLWKGSELAEECRQRALPCSYFYCRGAGARPGGSVAMISLWQLRAVHVNTPSERGGSSSSSDGLLVSGKPPRRLTGLGTRMYSGFFWWRWEGCHVRVSLRVVFCTVLSARRTFVALRQFRWWLMLERRQQRRAKVGVLLQNVHKSDTGCVSSWNQQCKCDSDCGSQVPLTVDAQAWSERGVWHAGLKKKKTQNEKEQQTFFFLFPPCVLKWNRLSFLVTVRQLIRVLS